MRRLHVPRYIGGLGTPPPLSFDFASGTLPSGMTFSRSTVGTGFNSAGVLVDFAPQVPRFVYDPVTLASLGLLVETGRTNSVRNNTMVGASPPLTLPTNWGTGGVLSALSRNVIGTGVEDGIEYIDVQYVGTPSATSSSQIEFDTRTNIAAAVSQVWAASCFVRIVAGSLTNAAVSVGVSEYDGGGALQAGAGTTFVPTTAPLRTQRGAHNRTLTGATTAFVTPYIRVNYTISLPIDITLRIGLPQGEFGANASSPVRTSTVAVARGTDFALITNPEAFTLPVVVVQARAPQFADGSITARCVVKDGGASSVSVQITRSVSGTMTCVVTDTTTQASLPGAAPVAVNTDFALAFRTLPNDFAFSLNGATTATDTAGTMPTITFFRVGGATSTTLFWGSTIKRIELRTAATDAELQVLSAAPVGYDADALLWLQQVLVNGSTVSNARLQLVSNFITAEKAAGTWQLTDDYWGLWGENEIQARISLKQRRLATLTAAPTFSADRHYAFDGVAQFMDTGFIPSTHAVAMTAASCRLAVYERTGSGGTTYTAGCNNGAPQIIALRTRQTASIVSISACSTLTVASSGAGTSMGYTVGSRRSAAVDDVLIFKDGVSRPITTPATSAGALPTFSMYVGGLNSSGAFAFARACTVGFMAIGASLSDAQELSQYNNTKAFATAIGANV